MTFAERTLYHQIHPAKLFADIATALVGIDLFWRHELAAGLIHRAPSARARLGGAGQRGRSRALPLERDGFLPAPLHAAVGPGPTDLLGGVRLLRGLVTYPRA